MISIKRRRNFAVVLFVLVLVFFAVEVFAVMTAKEQHDYRVAKGHASELSVELSLISSALSSGNHALYDNSLARFNESYMRFSENDYAMSKQGELLNSLSTYRDVLEQNRDSVIKLMDLSAALSNIQSDLIEIDDTKLDVANLYQIQRTFKELRDVIAKIGTTEFADATTRLDDFAERIASLSSSAAVCVSVCPKDSFVEKQQQLQTIKNDFSETFRTVGRTLSAKYDPSKLIVELGKI